MPRTVRSSAQSRGRRVRRRVFIVGEARSPGWPVATLVVKTALSLGFVGLRAPASPPRRLGPHRLRLRACALVATLLDPGGLAHQPPQVVKACLSHLAVPQYLDLVYAGRMDQERALHAHAVGHPADRYVGAQPSPGDADHEALEDLDSLASSFHHLGVHLHGVAGAQLRQLFFLLLLFDLVDHVHGLPLYGRGGASFMPAGPGVRPAPALDGGVVAGKQDLWDIQAAPLGGPRELWISAAGAYRECVLRQRR